MSHKILEGAGPNTGRFGTAGQNFEDACAALAGAALHAARRLREVSRGSGTAAAFQSEFAGLETALDAYTDKMATALAALSD